MVLYLLYQMEISVNNLFKTLILIACAFINMINTAYAQITGNPCEPKPLVFAFFNGVQTTDLQAEDALKKMKILYGESVPSSINGQKIQYELMYNYTQGFEDFVETFDQRLKEHIKLNDDEHMRYELFFQAVKGNGSWLSSVKI